MFPFSIWASWLNKIIYSVYISLEKSRAVGHGFVYRGEDYISVVIRETGYQYFGHEASDLFGREVNDAYHLFADELFGFVVCGDLGTGFAGSKRAKVDP